MPGVGVEPTIAVMAIDFKSIASTVPPPGPASVPSLPGQFMGEVNLPHKAATRALLACI